MSTDQTTQTAETASLLAAAEIVVLEESVRIHLGSAIASLTALREGHAHTVAGLAWHDYVLDRFGDLLADLHLPADERHALVGSMRTGGASLAAIADRLGVSKSLIKKDVDAIEATLGRPLVEKVVAVDGKIRDAATERAARFTPTPGMTKREQTVARVAHAGERGLTCLELANATGWRHGMASSPLTTAKQRGQIRPTGIFREGFEVYVISPQD